MTSFELLTVLIWIRPGEGQTIQISPESKSQSALIQYRNMIVNIPWSQNQYRNLIIWFCFLLELDLIWNWSELMLLSFMNCILNINYFLVPWVSGRVLAFWRETTGQKNFLIFSLYNSTISWENIFFSISVGPITFTVYSDTCQVYNGFFAYWICLKWGVLPSG